MPVMNEETAKLYKSLGVAALNPDQVKEAIKKEPGWEQPDQRLKLDAGKTPWHLFPYDAAGGIVKILEFGAKKYAARGWEAGMDYSRVYSALQRHMTSWWHGENKDQETGYSHLWHAGCCIMFLIAYEMRGIGKDDRPK